MMDLGRDISVVIQIILQTQSIQYTAKSLVHYVYPEPEFKGPLLVDH